MLRQLLHISLSALLLFSTTGISIKQHYCMGELQYASLNIWAPPCCGDDSEMKPNCCKDVFTHHQLEDEYQGLDIIQIVSPEQQTYLPFLFPIKIVEPYPVLVTPHYCQYKPPLIFDDVRIRVQSLLI